MFHRKKTLMSVLGLLALAGCSTRAPFQVAPDAPLSAQAVSYGDLPADRFPPNGWTDVTWSDPGGWTTLNVGNYGLSADTSSVDAAQKVRDILASTSGRRILYFPAGVYYFKTDLEISVGNVRLVGAGMDKTEFRITAPSSANAEIAFVGSGLEGEVDVTSTPGRGDASVTVADASGFRPNHFVYLYNKAGGAAYGIYLEAQIARVVAVSGNTLELDMKLGLDLADPKLQRLGVTWNVGIEGVKVHRTRAADDANTNNILFKNVYNGYARDLESSYAERAHIYSVYSRRIVVERVKAHHAYSYATAGRVTASSSPPPPPSAARRTTSSGPCGITSWCIWARTTACSPTTPPNPSTNLPAATTSTCTVTARTTTSLKAIWAWTSPATGVRMRVQTLTWAFTTSFSETA